MSIIFIWLFTFISSKINILVLPVIDYLVDLPVYEVVSYIKGILLTQ